MRKWITALSIALLSIVLLSVASFFLYWGVRNYLFGSRIGRFYFGLVWIGFGGSIIIIGIIGVLKLVPFLKELSE